MDTIHMLEELQTNWQLPDWREIVATVRNQFWLILMIDAIYSGGAVFIRWSGHPFLLFFPQMLLGLLLTLVYYRIVIDPDFPILDSFSRSAVLLPFAIWTLWLMTAASVPGLLLLVVPGIYIYARLMLVQGLVAADRPGISDHPLKSSWKLTERHSAALFAVSAAMMAYAALMMIAARRLGTFLEPSVIIFSGLLGLPASAGWMGYTAICSARAIHAQPKELLANLAVTARPTGWGTWFARLLAGFGLIIAFSVLMIGVGSLGTTRAGGKVMRALIRLGGTGGNVVIHGKTVLAPPAPWIANPKQNIPASLGVSFDLLAVGGVRAPQIRVSWLPISAPTVIDQPTAQRLSGLVVSGMDALELQQAKVLSRLYDLEQRDLAEYRITGLSIVQNPDPHGWIVVRTRGIPAGVEAKRDRFMPWDGGLLVFSDTFNSRDAQTIETQERPLLDALKL